MCKAKKKFMKSIRRKCCFPRNYKTRFLKEVENDLDLFLEDKPDISYRELTEEFGEPSAVIANYCAALPPEILQAQIHPHMGRWIAAFAAIALVLVGGFTYLINPFGKLNNQTVNDDNADQACFSAAQASTADDTHSGVSDPTSTVDAQTASSDSEFTNSERRSPSEIPVSELLGDDALAKNTTIYDDAGSIAVQVVAADTSDDLISVSIHTVPNLSADAADQEADTASSEKSMADMTLMEFLGEDFFLHNASYYDADGNKIMTVRNLSGGTSADQAMVMMK